MCPGAITDLAWGYFGVYTVHVIWTIWATEKNQNIKLVAIFILFYFIITHISLTFIIFMLIDNIEGNTANLPKFTDFKTNFGTYMLKYWRYQKKVYMKVAPFNVLQCFCIKQFYVKLIFFELFIRYQFSPIGGEIKKLFFLMYCNFFVLNLFSVKLIFFKFFNKIS